MTLLLSSTVVALQPKTMQNQIYSTSPNNMNPLDKQIKRKFLNMLPKTWNK